MMRLMLSAVCLRVAGVALVYPKDQLQFSKTQYSFGKINILLDRNGAKLAFLSLILFFVLFSKQGLELLEFPIPPR